MPLVKDAMRRLQAVLSSESLSEVPAVPAWFWTDPAIMRGVTPVSHPCGPFIFWSFERRSIRRTAPPGRAPPGYTDALRAGVTPIEGLHIEELRRAVRLLE